MRITRRVEFDAAHRLPDHDGKCRRLHGHRYVVDVTVDGPVHLDGPKRGMVVDFGDLDLIIADVIGEWDHRTLLWDQDPMAGPIAEIDPESVIRLPFVPTAENLAGYIAHGLGGHLDPTSSRAHVVEVRVQETPRGWATWTR